MNLINSGMFTPFEIEIIKSWAGKIYAKNPSDFMQYGVLTFDQLTKYLKDSGRWPHELFTQYILEVATLDYWISQNQNHQLINMARARLSAMSTVVVRMMSTKTSPDLTESIQVPDEQPKSHGIAWFMEQYGKATDALFATKKRISFISMFIKKQSESLSALDLAVKVREDIREAEEKALRKALSGQTVSIEESQQSIIEAVQKALDIVKQNQK